MRGKGLGVMFQRSKAAELREGVANTAELTTAVAGDKEFRKQVVGALVHAAAARDRAASRVGVRAAAGRLVTDEVLRQELSEMIDSLRTAWALLESKKSHRVRNTLLVLVGGGVAAAVALPQIRRRLMQ